MAVIVVYHPLRYVTFCFLLSINSKVVSEYDRLFAEMANNGTRNGMLTREQQLQIAEHEQSLEDMAALERSHEDLCRRYNRLKTVLAQFKRVNTYLYLTQSPFLCVKLGNATFGCSRYRIVRKRSCMIFKLRSIKCISSSNVSGARNELCGCLRCLYFVWVINPYESATSS